MNASEIAAIQELATKIDQLIAKVEGQQPPAPLPDNTADIQALTAKVDAELAK